MRVYNGITGFYRRILMIEEALVEAVTFYCLRGNGLVRNETRCISEITRCMSRYVVTPRNSMQVYSKCVRKYSDRIGRYRR